MNAVSATRNTLNASMKNCSRPTTRLPNATILEASADAARKVISENATLSSGAHRRPPYKPRITAPANGVPRRSRNSTLLLLLQGFEMLQIQAVELFADLEEEHAENQHRHQHVESDAQFDHHRHAVGRAHRAEEQPIFHRQESAHLGHGLAASDHGEERDQDHGDGDADRIARSRAGERRNRLRQPQSKKDEEPT